MKRIAVFLMVLASVQLAQAQITVHGSVHNADGSAPILAHAHIGKMHEAAGKSRTIECDKNGNFSITVAENGLYELRLSAVNHTEVSMPLVLTGTDRSVGVDVTLKANDYDRMPERVVMIGDWNKFAFSGTDTLAPVRKGDSYMFVGSRIATGDTLAYQLLSVAGNHSVNGSQADYYTYDGGGDYRSVMRTKPGQTVTISYDPAKMQYRAKQGVPLVAFSGSELQQKSYAIYSTAQRMSDEMMTQSGSERKIDQQKYDALISMLRSELDGAKMKKDRAYTEYVAVTMASEYNSENPFSKDDATMILTTVPASSPLWSLAAREVVDLAGHVDPELGQRYLHELESNPEHAVRAIALVSRLEAAYTAKRTQEARELYKLLKSDYKDVEDIKWEMTRLNPDAVVQVGNAIPHFELALLGEASKVSDKSMLGHYYMMDFWATWCGPCVREMPAIHKAYEKFRGRKGFEILSISMDASEAQIAPFRAKKWKMPWLHAFIPGIFNADLAKEFEVAGIPRPILVGPDGKIVAMEDAMRGENLEKTLAKFLGEPN